MFLRLLYESFVRQRRRKLLAGIAILLGTTAVTAMLALATSIGDRIHRELAVYGANIVVTPKAANLDVKIAGVDIKPATGNAYLKESDLEKLHGIFWANNITGVSPELDKPSIVLLASDPRSAVPVDATGLWFNHKFGNLVTGAQRLHPWWKLQGRWPAEKWFVAAHREDGVEVVVGQKFAQRFNLKIGDWFIFADPRGGYAPEADIVGIVTTGDSTENGVLFPLHVESPTAWVGKPFDGEITRVEISATTRPEDAFARLDPDKLSPKQHDIWYCRPYANSIAYQIMEAIPGSQAEQVRKVEQTEGTVLSRISGLMWLISIAALLAAAFAVSAAMATAVLERRGEIGLMRSLGASKAAIAALFYAESSLLALAAGTLGYIAGSLLAFYLGRHIFSADASTQILTPILLPIVVAMAVVVAILGSTPSIRAALNVDPSATLRGGQ